MRSVDMSSIPMKLKIWKIFLCDKWSMDFRFRLWV